MYRSPLWTKACPLITCSFDHFSATKWDQMVHGATNMWKVSPFSFLNWGVALMSFWILPLGITLKPAIPLQGNRAACCTASSRWLNRATGRSYMEVNPTYKSVNLIIRARRCTQTHTTNVRPLATGWCIIQPKSLLGRAHNGTVMKDWCVKKKKKKTVWLAGVT